MTPPPSNPRMHVVNPGEEKKKSQRWETIQTVALTTVVGLAVAGIAVGSWKLASKRVAKLLRRQQAEQEAVAAAAPAYGYPQAAGYPAGYAYYPPQYPPWPSPQVREQMPDALREIPTFHAPAAPPPVMPITQVHPSAPPVMPSADPMFRKFMTDLNGRFSSIDKRLDQINEQLGDEGEEDDDDEDDEPPRRRGRGGN